jgi:hypothetical protein
MVPTDQYAINPATSQPYVLVGVYPDNSLASFSEGRTSLVGGGVWYSPKISRAGVYSRTLIRSSYSFSTLDGLVPARPKTTLLKTDLYSPDNTKLSSFTEGRTSLVDSGEWASAKVLKPGVYNRRPLIKTGSMFSTVAGLVPIKYKPLLLKKIMTSTEMPDLTAFTEGRISGPGGSSPDQSYSFWS